MGFNTDKQTLNDLNIFSKRGRDSIFSIFNHTSTRAGSEILEAMFLNPLSDPDTIIYRTNIINFFKSREVAFPLEGSLLDTVEQYMADTDERSKLSYEENVFKRKLSALIAGDTGYKNIRTGVAATLELLKELQKMTDNPVNIPAILIDELHGSLDILEHSELAPLLRKNRNTRLNFKELSASDQLIRFSYHKEIEQILQWVYRLDVFVSVAKVARQLNLVLPLVLPMEQNYLSVEGLYHPHIAIPVSNSVSITRDFPVIFLTGANMAGKSTFMKSLGVALYLAHMGFPVPATKMEFSVRDGIYTTINLPDDLSSGSSHFYTEVLRVKKIAKELAGSKRLFIIFDELFRGTNVQDACEGTIALTEAFSKRQNCVFVVSTHIIEAGEALKECCKNINFVYLPTRMEGKKPVYTYKLQNGITADRHGMVIINNERILEILRIAKTTTLQS
ncbi:MutS-related protein [Mucilaginibacter aquaedulcis]|uniref:MutS-related protein n=1 Tax=Mucilaginibacter aquaedulcis TaxID=1187081 RepID=UPI0025B50219|nr:DNA mismatch repair protein [Mucilaginibacter aquaedulcis]MDN3548840.1 DNA mismatch repair protein [Mucilaginibacter aquaedulcis]